MYSAFIMAICLVLQAFFLPTFAFAVTEYVTVVKILQNDDYGIIVRANGDAYQIEKGVGCLSFWRYEGKQVLISSPGIFLGTGSQLILPDNDQKCRIWDSKKLGRWGATSAPERKTDSVIESQVDGEFEGWEGETIVKLTNGQIWQQSEYHYNYHYAYMPKVIIYKKGSRYEMMVDGTDKAVAVKKIR